MAGETPGRYTRDLLDPRVFFAAERTLLAWTRTSLTLMAFGFVIERAGLFAQMFYPADGEAWQRGFSLWLGIAFILLGGVVAVFAVQQYRALLKNLQPQQIPSQYRVNLGPLTNFAVALFGVALVVYLIF